MPKPLPPYHPREETVRAPAAAPPARTSAFLPRSAADLLGDVPPSESADAPDILGKLAEDTEVPGGLEWEDGEEYDGDYL